MLGGGIRLTTQKETVANPDARISTDMSSSTLLSKFASSYVGFQNGDTPRWVEQFWERASVDHGWQYLQWTSDETCHFGGRNCILKWENGKGELARSEQAFIKGREAWGRVGVIVRHMRHLPAGLYHGDMYDQSSAVIVPHNNSDLSAIWAFCSSEKFNEAVRKVDRSVKVTNATLVKVPFDIEHWRRLGVERYPNGLPEPYSDDPRQWLFHGHPAKAEKGTALHVALARLCGYQWPAERDSVMRLSDEARGWIAKAAKLPTSNGDGLFGVPAMAGERPLADRLRSYLSTAFGAEWSDGLERRCVAEADEVLDKKIARDVSLEGWLRDRAFRQHCTLFDQRPFLWQIWDGQKDGFAAIVHYHRLNRANLEKLTFSLLGDWISRMKAADDSRRVEAATILQERLQAILEGEKPYDIFVRWKPLAKQPLGWEPDLDDGVRINIRPFVEAEVLREVPNVKWTKDRGTDVKGAPWYDVFKGQRINDHHTTLAEKRRARGL